MITRLSQGDHEITASVSDALDASASASVDVTVLPGAGHPTIDVSNPIVLDDPDPPVGDLPLFSAGPGQRLLLSAMSTDAEDGDLSNSIVWVSDDGPLGSGAQVEVALSAPQDSSSSCEGFYCHTIGISSTDGDGNWTDVLYEVLVGTVC